MQGNDDTDDPGDSEQTARPRGTPEPARDPLCPACDYNLRGLTGYRCPECGYFLGAGPPAASQIPWVHRKQTGLFRAYWRTVWLVTFGNRRFCEEFDRPVSYRHAQSFRWVCVLHAYVPLVLAALSGYGVPTGAVSRPWLSMVTSPMYFIPAGLFLCFAAMTGLPSYFFHPPRVPVEQQNRAVAMSYYACAPLAWTPVTAVIGGLSAVSLLFAEVPGLVLALLAALWPVALLIAWWLDLIHIARRTLQRSVPFLVLFALAVPILWVAVGVVIMVGIPLAFFLVAVVVSSLS